MALERFSRGKVLRPHFPRDNKRNTDVGLLRPFDDSRSWHKLSFRGFSNSSWLYPSPAGGVHAPPILSFNTAARPRYYPKISSFLDNMPFQPARKTSSLISSTIFSTPLLPIGDMKELKP